MKDIMKIVWGIILSFNIISVVNGVLILRWVNELLLEFGLDAKMGFDYEEAIFVCAISVGATGLVHLLVLLGGVVSRMRNIQFSVLQKIMFTFLLGFGWLFMVAVTYKLGIWALIVNVVALWLLFLIWSTTTSDAHYLNSQTTASKDATNHTKQT